MVLVCIGEEERREDLLTVSHADRHALWTTKRLTSAIPITVSAASSTMSSTGTP